ncbi:LytR C-terminal domain-containing protein [Nocardioides bigeumensis]|jgi:hypothetical protein|uniref:LytR/CpsA/Psr regulator C-terminal domain-containing protein n=1 Tax=Nocardioides bigeumensis TaxID=433657 RepID=A0ABP5KHP1_9ACTN
MVRGIRSTLTLVFLVALLVGAVIWGWGAATKPLPQTQDEPLCEEVAVEAGQRVYPDQVAVSIFNASSRAGLAGRTTELFLDSGFGEGDSGNAPTGTEVAYAQIWASDPKSPAVRLVKSYLGPRATITEGDQLGVGVVVVVGEEFEELVKGKKSVKAAADGFVCSPPGTTD